MARTSFGINDVAIKSARDVRTIGRGLRTVSRSGEDKKRGKIK